MWTKSIATFLKCKVLLYLFEKDRFSYVNLNMIREVGSYNGIMENHLANFCNHALSSESLNVR